MATYDASPISDINETATTDSCKEHINSFVWRIPSLNNEQTQDLCNGYIRRVSTKFIPIDIIKLCIKYIDDSNMISIIKNAQTVGGVRSKFFCIGQFKFFMDLYPNGYGVEDKDNVDIFLNLASLSPTIPRITISYCFIFNEMKENKPHSYFEAAFSDNDSSSCITRLARNDVVNIDVNTMTFTLKVKSLTVYNEIRDEKQQDNNDTDDIKQAHSTAITDIGLFSEGFIWYLDTVNDGKHGKYFESELFRIDVFKFMLKIYKTNDGEYDLCLCLMSLSPNIQRLCLYYRIIISESETHNDGTIAFGPKSLHFWPQPFLTKKHMNEYKHLTIKLEIIILDAFDKNGNNIAGYETLQNRDMTTKSNKYKWIVNDYDEKDDNNILKQMKNANYGMHFNSKCFSMHKFKWFMQFFPGGYNEESDSSADLFLYLVSIPPNVSYIAMNYSMTMKETNTNFTYSEQFSMDNVLTGWPSNALTQAAIQNLNKLTFGVEINLIDVFDINGYSMTQQYITNDIICNDGKEIVLPTRKYIWKINDIQSLTKIRNTNVRQCIMSEYFEMYGLKWYLQFFNLDKHPKDDMNMENNTCQLYIGLVLPSVIKRISFQYELIIKELNIIHSHFEQFVEDDTIIGLSNIKKPKLKDIIKLEEITFEAHINLIDVFDEKSDNITDKYIDECKDECIAKEINMIKYEYLWNISDVNCEKLKNAKNGSIYRSKLFYIDSLKFIMQICPNGSNPKRNGSFNWYIYCASIPPKVSKVVFYYNFVLKGADSSDIDSKELKVKSCSWGWGNNILKFEQIQDFKEMMFVLEMSIVDIFTFDGNVVHRNEYNKLIPSRLECLTMDEYKWHITDEYVLENMKNAVNEECFYSEIFGVFDDFQWRLQFFPNGSTKKFKGETILSVSLQSLPDYIGGISVYFELQIVETETRWTHCSHFRHDHLCQGWETARCSLKDIKELDELTLATKINLIDVYDNESNVITETYFNQLPNVTVDDEYLV